MQFTITPNIFRNISQPLRIVSLHERDITKSTLNAFLNDVQKGIVGISASYGTKGVLTALALSTHTSALRIAFSDTPSTEKAPEEPLQDALLCSKILKKLAFDAERVATALYLDYNMHINSLLDVQSLVPKHAGSRHSENALMFALGGPDALHQEHVLAAFCDGSSLKKPEHSDVIRAWATCNVSRIASLEKAIKNAASINTADLPKSHIHVLAKCVRDADRARALIPTVSKNDVQPCLQNNSGRITLEQSRFSTRIRQSENQRIVIQTDDREVEISGRATRVAGKTVYILPDNNDVPPNAHVRSVRTIGREEPSLPEADQTSAILAALQGKSTILSNSLAQAIFLGVNAGGTVPSIEKLKNAKSPSIHFPDRPLNDSQKAAVNNIISTATPISLIRGPPGTGKTTVIAAAVNSLIKNPGYQPNPPRTVWLVSQSNVAVKNIAERLVDVGFCDFKLLVSREYYLDWHEHLYKEKLVNNVICTDEIPKDSPHIKQMLRGARVILCTLSALSSHRVGGLTRVVPLETIIIDEASQIETRDYLATFHRYSKQIRKLAFLGDDKQLAPHGHCNIDDLQSIFEVKHLRKKALFLDTQYRMPVPIGQLISGRIYSGRLKSSHSITDPSSCRLVDVHHGSETWDNNGWRNSKEAKAVVRIARRYHEEQKAFRVLTPYDSQRTLIENELKRNGLPWEDKCFTVDSFQGNEADHIILSVVRTKRVGFLDNMRRANVMLSRCKKSMIICTNRSYLEDCASLTLLGMLAKRWGPRGWLSWEDVMLGKF